MTSCDKMVKKEVQQTGKFVPKLGEKVICSHHGVMYEAKVININESEQKYFVHYQGWNKNWDEWVLADRLKQFTPANEALMKETKSESTTKSKGSTKKSRNSVSSINSSLIIEDKEKDKERDKEKDLEIEKEKITKEKEKDPPIKEKIATPATKQIAPTSSGDKTESIFEDLELKRLKPEIKIKIPDELKNWLVDDENNIKNKKLSILPSKITISNLLKDYANYRKTSTKLPAEKEVCLNEFILGLKYSFNVMIGAHLLYKFERPQYQSLLKEHGKDPDFTTLYGPVHLLRMLTKIGSMLAYTSLDNKDVQTIVGHIIEILKFMKKQSNFFDVDKGYQIALPEYIRQYQRAVD